MRLRIMKYNKAQIFILHYSNIKKSKVTAFETFGLNYYK